MSCSDLEACSLAFCAAVVWKRDDELLKYFAYLFSTPFRGG